MASSLFSSQQNDVFSLLNLMRSPNVPQAMIESTIRNNPNYNFVMNLIAKYNGNAEQAFYALAREKGIDPTQFLNSLK